jgi:succinate dehydrogenase / fumarate reductase cytochrome b subunit
MAISGLLLSFFILIHALGNSTTFFGADVFNAYAAHLHSLGGLIYIFEITLVLIFAVHIVFGILLTLENYQARPSRYQAVKNSGGRTPGSRTMIFTGLLILLFLFVHLQNFHFTDHSRSISYIVRDILIQPLFGCFYLLALGGLGLHISHGFWSLLQTLGINHPEYNKFFRGSALITALLLTGIFVLIPVLALFWPVFLSG